jgi:membrane-associated phospholipid phosphatase
MKKYTLAAAAWLIVSSACVAHAQTSEPSKSASAPPQKRLQWDDEWPRFRTIGYALTAASAASALAVTFLIDYPSEPGWQGGISFDEAVRTAVRLRNPGARDAIRTASDITLATNIALVSVLDSLIVPVWSGSPEVASQLTLMNAQAFSLNILVATLLFKAVARERPLIRSCREDPTSDPLCGTGDYASFPSSHTSTAFTAAGLSCVHHQFLPIYGGAWDGVACAGSIAIALATGTFRVLGDRHYASDVIFGAIFGFSLGYIYPWLFHYRYDLDNRPNLTTDEMQWSIVPGGSADAPYGFSFAGSF